MYVYIYIYIYDMIYVYDSMIYDVSWLICDNDDICIYGIYIYHDVADKWYETWYLVCIYIICIMQCINDTICDNYTSTSIVETCT